MRITASRESDGRNRLLIVFQPNDENGPLNTEVYHKHLADIVWRTPLLHRMRADNRLARGGIILGTSDRSRLRPTLEAFTGTLVFAVKWAEHCAKWFEQQPVGADSNVQERRKRIARWVWNSPQHSSSIEVTEDSTESFLRVWHFASDFPAWNDVFKNSLIHLLQDEPSHQSEHFSDQAGVTERLVLQYNNKSTEECIRMAVMYKNKLNGMLEEVDRLALQSFSVTYDTTLATEWPDTGHIAPVGEWRYYREFGEGDAPPGPLYDPDEEGRW